LITDPWPPLQVEYLRVDLREIDCKTVVVEQHYIDRVFMHDDAVFYVRNLRSYPNFTSRLHFLPMSSTKANGGTWLPALPVVRTGGGSSHAITELSRLLRGTSPA
jgi:hypothetical protein